VGTRHASTDAGLKKTVLHDFHLKHGAKMVPFAGYSMPIKYEDSIMDSTTHCRSVGSIFDVSHMCGMTIKGAGAIPFIESLVVGDIQSLADNTGCLSVITNKNGGSIDDTVITKVNDGQIYMVVNAGCREKDLAHIGSHLDQWNSKSGAGDVSLHVHDERFLVAVQGPAAAAALQKLVNFDLSGMYFGSFKVTGVNGHESFITRTGYTGEDGFEISIPNGAALDVMEALLDGSGLKLAGLGARDSLRLEAGLCLYGNDLNMDISPIEAGLTWTIGKRRREKWDFVGGDIIKKQLEEGAKRRRIGLVCSGAPARQHSPIVSPEGEVVGEVTSGAFSPCLKKNIAMGYVKKGFHKAGTQLQVSVRNKLGDAVVTKMPFVETKYYRK